MSKITKKRLYAIFASLACVLAVLTSTFLVANASVVDVSWLRYPVQGYSTLGYYVYDEADLPGGIDPDFALPPVLCEVSIPLTHNIFPDAYYEETTWDSQFYYYNYYDTEYGDPTKNYASRIEYMQNADGEIPDVKYHRENGSIWGQYSAPIDVETYGFMQTNKAMMGSIEMVRFKHPDQHIYIPSPTPYSVIHYSLGDVYCWDEDSMEGLSEEASITQLIRIPFDVTGDVLVGLGIGADRVTYDDLILKGAVYSDILNVGTGERFYDTCDIVVRPDLEAREFHIYADINLPEDDDEVNDLYLLERFDAMLYVNRFGSIVDGVPGAFNFYTETQYHTLLNVNDIERSLQGQSKIEMPDYVDIGSWLAKGVGGFFNLQIVPGISLGGILAVFVAFGVTMYLIKLFLGG